MTPMTYNPASTGMMQAQVQPMAAQVRRGSAMPANNSRLDNMSDLKSNQTLIQATPTLNQIMDYNSTLMPGNGAPTLAGTAIGSPVMDLNGHPAIINPMMAGQGLSQAGSHNQIGDFSNTLKGSGNGVDFSGQASPAAEIVNTMVPTIPNVPKLPPIEHG